MFLLENRTYYEHRKKQLIINQLIDCGFYKVGKRQLYELELLELEKHLKNIKKERVILHS
ncbi:TPA: Fur-regulated basic protein FbpA [Bacillus cereus]|nr:Fur-regulated basic protein FbpA [Bacillus cereus]PGZ45068.1 Fur-regulated basic protein FbpA [Bacillus anthracis]MCU5031883.1 Fur-regulated basic protein FbpA [Bacillus cereus]MCU5769686.1 Fur-regulated basic protein FbpA [Bacillus cereus]HDR7001308.1 Fur-regulated basic protein FbpA [Bacillus cereus]